jgi:hypothetical protein
MAFVNLVWVLTAPDCLDILVTVDLAIISFCIPFVVTELTLGFLHSVYGDEPSSIYEEGPSYADSWDEFDPKD